MLSFIRRTLLGQELTHLKQLFYGEDLGNRTISFFKCHRFKLHQYLNGKQLAVVKRFAVGLDSIYTMLPTEIVETTILKCF